MQAASARTRLDSDRFFSTAGKRNLIGKDWVPALSGRELQVFDPSTGGILMTTPHSAREDVHQRRAAARRAFDQGPWTRMTPYERARIMLKIADLIEAHHEELSQIEAIDAGKPINAGPLRRRAAHPPPVPLLRRADHQAGRPHHHPLVPVHAGHHLPRLHRRASRWAWSG